MKVRHQQPGGAKSFAREKLVAAGRDRIWRVVGNTEALGREGGDISGTVAHGDDAVYSRVGQSLRSAFRIFETQRDGAIAPWVIEHVAAIGGENQVISQALRRRRENARLITGGGADQQQAHAAGRLKRYLGSVARVRRGLEIRVVALEAEHGSG